MWLSLNTISKMVDISDITPEELALKITMSTAEIEEIEYVNEHLKTIYTAKAETVKPHPDADKLTLVDTDKNGEKVRIVCGASNHKAGDIVALATVGTKFSEEFIIKKSKIRGEESFGMLCSDKELGFAESSDGIKIFPEGTPIGVPLSEIYPEWIDIRLEIDNKSITHRPDLWGHVGFAREIGAILGKDVTYPVNHDLTKEFGNSDELKITIEDAKKSPRYSGLVIKNIKVEESPDWLKAAVTSFGMRPINNIVDITNYVMAEIGEPMHAFDRNKLDGNEIVVRMAKADEKLTTLDDTEIDLTTDDIVIADKKNPIALAGVMGGGNSEIDENTTEIILEAATFDAVTIRKTAHKFDIRTDAAARFEKSLSPELTVDAIVRCYELIKKVLPNAEAISQIADLFPSPAKDITIEITTDLIRKNLGEDIPDERILSILTALDYKIDNKNGKLTIEVPHYRATKDVSIPVDIVEEVGRVYGYDNIKPVPPLTPCETPELNPFRIFENSIKKFISNNEQMIEVSGYSFTGESLLNRLKVNEDKELRLKNPLSIEHDRLRRAIMPNIIENITLNQKYNESFRIYEMGRTYVKEERRSPDLVEENFRLTGAVYLKKAETPVFYDAKNIISSLMNFLRVKKFKLVPGGDTLPPYAHPGRSMTIEIDKKVAGYIFELHPETKAEFSINGEAAILDIDLNLLFDTKRKDKKFEELQKFPEVPFEISVLTEKQTYAKDITSIIEKAEQNLIRNIEILSIYEGEQIPEDKKSVSIKIVFGAKNKTLNHDEIESLQNKVIKKLEGKGFNLR